MALSRHGEATNAQPTVADDHDSTGVEVFSDRIEVREEQRRLAVSATGHVASEQDDARYLRPGLGDEVAEVSVERDEHAPFVDGSGEDDRIGSADKIQART